MTVAPIVSSARRWPQYEVASLSWLAGQFLVGPCCMAALGRRAVALALVRAGTLDSADIRVEALSVEVGEVRAAAESLIGLASVSDRCKRLPLPMSAEVARRVGSLHCMARAGRRPALVPPSRLLPQMHGSHALLGRVLPFRGAHAR